MSRFSLGKVETPTFLGNQTETSKFRNRGDSEPNSVSPLDLTTEVFVSLEKEKRMENGESFRANWTQSQDEYFVELLVEQVRKGNKTGHGFTKQAWSEMVMAFNEKRGFQYDTDVLRNRYRRLRKQYTEIKSLVAQTGFFWDDSLKLVKADDNSWTEFLKANPEMQLYKTKVVPYYNELCIICGHAVADGRYSLSCFDLDFENEALEVPTPTKDEAKRIHWSESMEQFFVGVMLEQARNGNKTGPTFKKKTWVVMIAAFNAKFMVQYSRSVLKTRYNILRRHYGNIKTLLGQKGFCWDKGQNKVVADDCVWNAYVKEHPNFQMYKHKVMPHYTDMCTICCNEATSRKKPPSCVPISKKEAVENNVNKETTPIHKKSGTHEKKRAQPEITPTLIPSLGKEESLDNDDNNMGNALLEMAIAVSSLRKKPKEEKPVSIENVIGILQAIPDIDDDLLLDACDLLEDERRARMFLALDSTLRKKWLIRKLRPDQ